ncbi:MAG TPA: hypothetical protein VLT84_06955, partial [Acidobacteriota bacterium]|nr:hypothetical protein [Acidobacteriota bacterium]
GVSTVIMMVSFVVGFNNQITAAFTSFGTHLVQFQKYEPRFGGGPGGPPEEQRNRRDLTYSPRRRRRRLPLRFPRRRRSAPRRTSGGRTKRGV